MLVNPLIPLLGTLFSTSSSGLSPNLFQAGQLQPFLRWLLLRSPQIHSFKDDDGWAFKIFQAVLPFRKNSFGTNKDILCVVQWQTCGGGQEYKKRRNDWAPPHHNTKYIWWLFVLVLCIALPLIGPRKSATTKNTSSLFKGLQSQLQAFNVKPP